MGSVLRSVLNGTCATMGGENAHLKGVPNCDGAGYHGAVIHSRPTDRGPDVRRPWGGNAPKAVGGDYGRAAFGGSYRVGEAQNARQAGAQGRQGAKNGK